MLTAMKKTAQLLQSINMVDERFVAISNLYKAGLSSEEEPQLFYQRTGFKELSQFIYQIVAGCHIGLIDGLPGTGKSSTLWWGLQKLASRSLLWIHLDRLGNVTDVVKVQGTSLQAIPVPTTGWSGFLAELPKISAQSTILVFDGVNHNIYNDALVATRDFFHGRSKDAMRFLEASKYGTNADQKTNHHPSSPIHYTSASSPSLPLPSCGTDRAILTPKEHGYLMFTP